MGIHPPAQLRPGRSTSRKPFSADFDFADFDPPNYTVPVHAGETFGPGLLKSILYQAGITADELRSVL